MNPKYSVIVITYFHEDYIKKTLESILMQSVVGDLEIIIGDDGSKDNTVKILNEYKEKYSFIHIFAHENVGISKNLYDLLKKANGEYIAILEGDDYWIDVDKLKKQRFIIENNDCIATACNSLKVDNQGNTLGVWNNYLESGVLTVDQVLSYQTKICHPSGFFFKNIFKNSGNKYEVVANASRMGGCHSGMINLLASNGGIYYDNSLMVVWRVVTGTGTKNYTSQSHNNPLDFYDAMRKYIMYDKYFAFNYERHIYTEFRQCVKAMRKEVVSNIGCYRFFKGIIEYNVYNIISKIKKLLNKV